MAADTAVAAPPTPAAASAPGSPGSSVAFDVSAQLSRDLKVKDIRQSIHYVVQPGDTLSGIADKVLGDAAKWKMLLEENQTLLAGNERALQPGMTLVVSRDDAAPPEAPARMAIPLGARDVLVRVLERRLLALALYERLSLERRAQTTALPEDIASLSVPAASATAMFADARVALTVLLAKDEDQGKTIAAARTQLKELGLTITGEGTGPNGQVLLVGESNVAALLKLALVPGVVRIEPTEKSAPSAR
ncbi:MAG: LysM peptidoglycan-binding domain-containing protein [Phycisphaerae bacterium]|nr:LysM peptidoglycan-binding domain-containing protein [Phycisphaerae bacterium]